MASITITRLPDPNNLSDASNRMSIPVGGFSADYGWRLGEDLVTQAAVYGRWDSSAVRAERLVLDARCVVLDLRHYQHERAGPCRHRPGGPSQPVRRLGTAVADPLGPQRAFHRNLQLHGLCLACAVELRPPRQLHRQRRRRDAIRERHDVPAALADADHRGGGPRHPADRHAG